MFVLIDGSEMSVYFSPFEFGHFTTLELKFRTKLTLHFYKTS